VIKRIAGTKVKRSRTGRRPVLKSARLLPVSATVIRLTPSATASWLALFVTLNCMLEASDQRASARRAARTTCAPVAWMKGGGLLSEVESATLTVVVGQWICVAAVVLVYCKV